MKFSNQISKLIPILIFAFICSNIILVEAKRGPPPVVTPVIYDGVNFTTGKMGYVDAWDISTGKLLWDTKVYSINYIPGLETDVQDVFITSLNISDGKLIVVNEKGNRYEVNVITGAVYNDNSKLLFSIFIVFLVLIITYLLYNKYRKKEKKGIQ